MIVQRRHVPWMVLYFWCIYAQACAVTELLASLHHSVVTEDHEFLQLWANRRFTWAKINGSGFFQIPRSGGQGPIIIQPASPLPNTHFWFRFDYQYHKPVVKAYITEDRQFFYNWHWALHILDEKAVHHDLANYPNIFFRVSSEKLISILLTESTRWENIEIADLLSAMMDDRSLNGKRLEQFVAYLFSPVLGRARFDRVALLHHALVRGVANLSAADQLSFLDEYYPRFVRPIESLAVVLNLSYVIPFSKFEDGIKRHSENIVSIEKQYEQLRVQGYKHLLMRGYGLDSFIDMLFQDAAEIFNPKDFAILMLHIRDDEYGFWGCEELKKKLGEWYDLVQNQKKFFPRLVTDMRSALVSTIAPLSDWRKKQILTDYYAFFLEGAPKNRIILSALQFLLPPHQFGISRGENKFSEVWAQYDHLRELARFSLGNMISFERHSDPR